MHGKSMDVICIEIFLDYLEKKFRNMGNELLIFVLTIQIIQVPQGKYKILPTERTKVSPYPVSLIPGQFQEYYKRYQKFAVIKLMCFFLMLFVVLLAGC